MHRISCIPTAALVIAALPWTLDASAADNAQPRAVCTSITNVNQLQAMRNNLAGNYCLANDIDASAKPNFAPVGSIFASFTGKFNGNGHVIRNLRIRSGQSHVGLFGVANAATIRNVTLLNVAVVGTASSTAAGGLAGFALAEGTNSIGIVNVHVSGRVRCLGNSCDVGGIVGSLGSFSGTKILRNSSSSADVTGSRFVGGVVGVINHATITRSYATGATRCTGNNCMAGGLVGRSSSGTVTLAFATGPVAAADGGDSRAGGLIAYGESSAALSRSYAAGPVSGGATGIVGGLVGQWNASGTLTQTYAVGPVSGGATRGGLTGNAFGGAVITNSYWDTDTTDQVTSSGGVGLTTTQLRADLPAGFGNAWGITKTLSYPFLLAPQIDFASPLATLVRPSTVSIDKVFVFLPISQLDGSQYLTPPENADLAVLATVYTMIARAIGIAQNVNQLTNVAIDRYFWDDATQSTTWKGPVKNYATLGPFTAIAGNTPLDVTNVVGAMNMREQVVILRGRYTSDGTNVTHWMLGTLYTEDDNGNPTAILAHDPWTGQQVKIDPTTKRVVSPENFPLANFKVNGYRTVTVN
ncbi:MAG: hypothetical protein GEU91_03705 [Rhizobiales bacterium]|nr:hypothetical protein [Hyphomicrobiales bacterium]